MRVFLLQLGVQLLLLRLARARVLVAVQVHCVLVGRAFSRSDCSDFARLLHGRLLTRVATLRRLVAN